MASLGLPFQGKIWYWVEASYGGGESGSTLPISVKVIDARPGIGSRHKALRGIDSPHVCKLLGQCEDYTFHLEYIPQDDDTLLDDVVDREADGTLQSLAFCLGTNVLIGGGTDESWYYMVGCKPKTIRVSASTNSEYTIAIDFSVKSTTTDTAKTGNEPSALTGEICAFNIAGSITQDGGAFAYIVNSVDISIDHGLKDYWDHDSVIKQYCVEGELSVTGSVDISLDEGGAMHLAEVLALTEFDIVVNLAAAGPTITITDAAWDSSEIDVNISGEAMMESAPWTAHSVAVS